MARRKEGEKDGREKELKIRHQAVTWECVFRLGLAARGASDIAIEGLLLKVCKKTTTKDE